MSDLLSRQEIIELIEYRLKHMPKGYHPQFLQGLEDGYCRCLSDIRLWPSAQPKRKKGKWILTEDDNYEYCTCSECGYQNGENWMNGSDIPFCAMCGADMRGEKE